MHRTAAYYVVGAWLMFQAADIFFPAWGLSDSAVNLLLIAVAIGFPLALIFGWQFDVTSSGLKRTAAVGPAVSESKLRVSDYALLSLLFVGGVAILVSLFGRLQQEIVPSPFDVSDWLSKATSVAVLPFQDLSPSGEKAFFTDGLHAEVIAQLSKIYAFRVPSRKSVMRYRESPMSATEIARELEVSAILEGTVGYAGDRVRVSVQLIEALSDDHVWSKTYDAEVTAQALFEIQSDVALQIADALERQLTTEEFASVERPRTDSIQAYEAYLKGRYEFMQLNAQSIAAAREHFGDAIEFDPDFAEAYQQLGWLYAYEGTTYGTMRPDETYPIAEEYAQIALKLDPTIGRTHELLATILYWYRWDTEAAEPIFQSSVELSPKDFSVYTGYAFFLASLGRHDEALKAIDVAIAVDPKNTNVYSNAGWRQINAGDYDKAIEMAEIALDIDPDFTEAEQVIGSAMIFNGDYDDAIELLMKNGNLVMAGYAQGISGDTDEARKKIEYFETLSETQFVSADWLARLYVGIGDYDAAFEKLNDAIDERSRDMLVLDVRPEWAPLRDDPRYEALRSRIVPLASKVEPASPEI